MKLTEEQKKEVKDWIKDVPKYRETFNELYDHILNSLEVIDHPFNTDLVDEIVLKDFGGYQTVFDNEKNYRNKIGRKYLKFFYIEMLNTFRWPEVINNLIVLLICLAIYFNSAETFNLQPILWGSFGCCILVAVFMYVKIIKNRIRYSKYSLLDNYIQEVGALGVLTLNVTLQFFLAKDSMIATSHQTKLIFVLLLFFFTSIYVRAFIKFYNQKLKVLGI